MVNPSSVDLHTESTLFTKVLSGILVYKISSFLIEFTYEYARTTKSAFKIIIYLSLFICLNYHYWQPVPKVGKPYFYTEAHSPTLSIFTHEAKEDCIPQGQA